ncbi:MAG: cytochrome c3 family protein, partial [Actinobacteria bacterium]|nr:cytochrome c3 family protein [Actinomycetota bacterium]
MKRLLLLAVITAALVLTFGGAALANFGIHGAYMADTDACAGCHRAHTANSALTWQDSQGGNRSALLVVTPSKAASTIMTDFCYTCHGSAAPGASTDVQTGVFDASSNVPTENGIGFLNGGGFDSAEGTNTTSYHIVDNSWLMYGSTVATSTGYTSYSFTLTCTQCHDVHGSSNYRILKDKVNGHTVGGYTAKTAGERDTFNGMPVQDG